MTRSLHECLLRGAQGNSPAATHHNEGMTQEALHESLLWGAKGTETLTPVTSREEWAQEHQNRTLGIFGSRSERQEIFFCLEE